MAVVPGPALADVDPFYLDSLERGVAAYDRGDFEDAEERLRVACFGMLEEPTVLADGLVRLGLAQAALGDRAAFVETFGRLDQLEELFSAYSRARASVELRSEFEGQATQWVPAGVLQNSVAFSRLYRERERQRIQALAVPARIAELERMLSRDPGNADWRLMLAAARVERGDSRNAIADLEKVLVSQPDQPQAVCLLARSFLQIAQCDGALEQVLRCDIRRLPTTELIQYLDCLSEAERWPEAASVIVSLPPEVRDTRALKKRERRIAGSLPPEMEIEPLPPFTPSSAARAATPTSRAESPAPAIPLGFEPSRVPEPELRALREKLDGATSLAELEQVTAEAESLRSLYPEAKEPLYLAGEAAYRSSDWQAAADYLRAAGEPPEERPELLFYLSVSLYEIGDLGEAAGVLRRALPHLQRTPIVDRYVRSILADS